MRYGPGPSLLKRLERIAAGKLSPPLYVEIHPTDACNHQCIWCIAYETRLKASEIPLPRLLSLLTEVRQVGVRSVMFSGGGDPLYYPKIDEVIQHARSLGLEISISTNGGSLEKPMRQLLLATVKGHIRFSIDSGNPHAHFQLHRPLNENGKDDFETIVANVADLIRERGRRTRPVIGMSFILHPNNVDSLPLFLERAIELHVDFVDIKQNYRFSRSANDNLSSKAHPIVQEYAQKAHRMDIKFQHFTPRKGLSNASKCAQSWYMLDLVAVITSDGKLYPCCHLMSPDYCQGDIITQSFSSVWFSESRNQWRENLLKNGIACRVCVDKQLEKKLRLVATALTADDEAAVEEAFIELMK